MNIGIAQIQPSKGNIAANIEKHVQLIELAHTLGASSVFFPELSLTSYEPILSKELALNQQDERLNKLQEISNLKNITIGLGIPKKVKNGIQISMLIFQPNAPRTTYSKQQLHEDEFPYFENGTKQLIIKIKNKNVIPAICYESLQIKHAEQAVLLGGQIYIASVAKSQKGINKAFVHYPKIAKKYAMPVLMSNCIGECDDFLSVGLSSIWTTKGELAGQLDNKTEGIIVYNTETEEIVQQYL